MPLSIVRTLASVVLEQALRLSGRLSATLDSWARFFKKTSGWRQVLPPETEGTHLLAVCMVNQNIGFAVGRRGCIIKTIDSGQTWTRLAQSLTIEDFYAVHFADASIGYAVGQKGTILRTDDGGANWAIQSCPLGNRLFCTGVFVVDGQKALIVGGTEDHRWTGEYSNSYKPGHTFLTNDGGQTWSPPQSTPTIVPFLNDIRMTSLTTGVAVGGCWDNLAGTYSLTSIIMRTTDGGQSWSQQSFPAEMPFPPLMWKVSLHDPNTAIALGLEGPPIYTSDGQTWHGAIVDRLYTGLEAISFLDASTAIFVGSQFRGAIMKSTDAGANWTTIDHGTYPSLRGISFGSPSTGIAVGEFSTVVRTVDGGETWQRCNQFLPWAVGSDEDVEAVHFQGNTGYAVGWRGTVIKSTDAGSTWQRVNSVLPGLHCVYFKDEQEGFFGINQQFGRRGFFQTVDGGATIEEFKTANNGDTYLVQEGPGTNSAGHIAGISFGDGQTGIFFSVTGIGGERTTIYRTTEGGSTWRRVELPSIVSEFLEVHDVQFITPTTVIAVGGSGGGGVVLRSFDAGVTWQRLNLPHSGQYVPGSVQGELNVKTLRAVHFPPGQDQIGFAVGDAGTVIKTTDGGISWTNLTTTTGLSTVIYGYWEGVYFIDELSGWIVGEVGADNKVDVMGRILRTYDGGETWQEQGMLEATPDPLYAHGLKDVFFLSPNIGLVVGTNGFIARTTTGGA